MNAELDKKLCEEFPSIFKNRNGKITETCMAWGFDCGDGWYPLLRALCLNIQHTKQEVTADQVKEKYGGLRFYYSGGDRYIDGLVSMAETMSEYTCESCGDTSTAKIRGTHWLCCSCDKCWEEKIKV